MISRTAANLIVENDLTVEFKRRGGVMPEGTGCMMVEVRCKSNPKMPTLGFFVQLNENSHTRTIVEVEAMIDEFVRALKRR